MLAGFAEADITPPVGTLIPGGFFPNISTDISCELFVNAAAFTSDGGSVILISMDILSSKPWYTDSIRKRVSSATGVPADNILVAATHTHSGPAVEYQLWLCPPDEAAAAARADIAVKTATTAWNSRTEALIGAGVSEERRYSFNRDYYMTDGTIRMNPGYSNADKIVKPAGEVDYSVNFLRVGGRDGKINAFLVNYANHACCHNPGDNFHISSDYPGYLRRALKERYGSNVKVLFFNGCAGDINCYDYINRTDSEYLGPGKNAPRVIGTALAEDIAAVNDKVVAEQECRIAALSRICTVSRRFRSAADLEWARGIAADMESHTPMDRAFATEYLENTDSEPDTVELEVQTIQLGPWAIVGLPSEIFTCIGLDIKACSPYPVTVVFELANGTHGYIPPEYIINSAAYEAKVSKYNSYCGIETAKKLTEQSLQQLRELKSR